jgi:uncharacterized phage protein (TIGR02218 family)
VKTMSVALKAHFALGSTTAATCWKATLRDGTVIASTALDRDITFESVTYESAASYMPTAIESGADMSPDNLELEGFMVSPQITEEDLKTGRWDFARVEIFLVNYMDLTQGRVLLRKGTLGEIRGSQHRFTVELRGLTQFLTRRIVRKTTKTCPWEFGDAATCRMDLGPITVTGSVVSDITNNRQFTDTARTEAADWFTGAKLTWLTGENADAGVEIEVKQSTPGGVITLHEQAPYPITVGDTYSMPPGCAKRLEEDCRDKHDNVVNFGGFPYLPLTDTYKRGGQQ